MSNISSHARSELVSVIIPSYNHSQFILECVRSVIDQDYKLLELIIIDDGSVDDSKIKLELLREACAARFTRFELRARENRGLAATLNEGLAWARGAYICTLASDDFWYPNKISVQFDFFECHPKIAMCSGNIDVVDADGRVIRHGSVRQSRVYHHKNIALFNYSMPATTFMYRSEVILAVGGFGAGVLVEDFYILLLLTSNGCEVANVGEIIAGYRRHQKNSSALFIEKHSNDRVNSIGKLVECELRGASIFIANCIFATQLLGFDKMRALSLLVRKIKIRYFILGFPRVLRFSILFFMPKAFIRNILWI